MGGKAAKRARKRENRKKKILIPHCEGCGYPAPSTTGNHDTPWSVNGVTWEGLAIVAFCQWCGCDTCV